MNRSWWKLTALAGLSALLLFGCRSMETGGGGGGGGGGGRRPHATEEEVRNAYTQLEMAWRRKDLVALDALIPVNAIFIDGAAGPGVKTWREARPVVEQFFQQGPAFQLTSDPSPRVVVDRDMAWYANQYHITVKTATGEQTADGAITILFQKRPDGSYRVLMLHGGDYGPPPPAPATSGKGRAKTK